MIIAYTCEANRLRAVEYPTADFDKIVWIDLLAPSREEELELEVRLGIDLPTREEMEEIEVSARLYTEGAASFMTATLPAQADADVPEMAAVTFILTGQKLITIRYHQPRAFQTFPIRAGKTAVGATDGQGVLIALLETIIERLADILERTGRDVDGLSRTTFQNENKPKTPRDFRRTLEEIGRKGDLTSNMVNSLVSLERLFAFLSQLMAQQKRNKDIRSRVDILTRDARSLVEHATFLSQKITLLLDATLGLVNIEQNAIIKIFSVAAVVFLPPTLIASIYGMNFQNMPELDWPLGYPFALGLMVISAIMPYLFFKRRGWL